MRSLSSPMMVRREPTRASSWSVAGASHTLLIMVVACFFGFGGMYVFAVNERAVYGYDMRMLEREIADLKKTNTLLRLEEAENRSLVRVEEGSHTLRMERAEPTGEVVVERPGPVAYR